MNVLKKITGWMAMIAVLVVASGCLGRKGGTDVPRPDEPPSNKLGVGDLVLVTFTGVEPPPSPHEERIKADGTITLSLINSVPAVGKTPGELQNDIRNAYVPKYYRESLNVTVKWQERFFFVGGQIRASARYPWTEGLTLVKAIQTAGGFNEDYAKRSKVRVTRLSGKTFIVNYDKAEVDYKFDVPIYPGDIINVPKRW